MTRDDWHGSAFATAWDEAGNRRTNPDRDNQISLIAELVVQSAPGHLLDLGIGSAQVEFAIQQHYRGFFERCTVSGLDASESMLSLAREREVVDGGLGLSLIQMDLADLDDYHPDRPPDTVICVQVLHELEDSIKQRVFHRVHALLPPGRPFYILDRFTYADDPWMNDWRACWQWMRQKVTGEVLDFDAYHRQYSDKTDHVTTLENYLSWLTTAGFDAVCPYHCFNRALIVARA